MRNKTINKLFIVTILSGLLSVSCTKSFEELNTNPAGVTDEEAMGDFALVSAFLAQAQRDIIPKTVGEYQLGNNLTSDAYGGYFGAQAPFVGNANNLNLQLSSWLVFVDLGRSLHPCDESFIPGGANHARR